MLVSIRCPECRQALRVPDGKRIRCPRCGRGVVAPRALFDEEEVDVVEVPDIARPVPPKPGQDAFFLASLAITLLLMILLGGMAACFLLWES